MKKVLYIIIIWLIVCAIITGIFYMLGGPIAQQDGPLKGLYGALCIVSIVPIGFAINDIK